MASAPRSRFATVLILAFAAMPAAAQPAWDCPAEAAALQNPVMASPDVIARGEKLARASCADCHGPSGHGDGPAASRLTPRPADWRTPGFQAQSDGCIFWKLSSGRGNMPASKGMPESDRWSVVRYIRSLGTE